MKLKFESVKKYWILTVFLLVSHICRADYDRIILGNLINNSTLIIECKIVKVLDNNIQVEVLEVLKGDWKFGKLLVDKFEDWTCAQRWAKHEPGQHQILFLNKGYDKEWLVMGAGNEGEMPIENEICYLQSSEHGHFHSLKGGEIWGVPFKLIDVKSVIKEYLINKIIIDNARKKKKPLVNPNPFMQTLYNDIE